MRIVFGLVDLPPIDPVKLSARTPGAQRENEVVLLRDCFLGTFDGRVIKAAKKLLERLGYAVEVSHVWPNGKALHVASRLRRNAHRPNGRD